MSDVMANPEETKRATRDYRSYSATPWGLWDTMYGRRSHRKYLPMESTAEFVGSLEDTVRLATKTRGAIEGSTLVVAEPGIVDGIRVGSYKGFQNKINLWLARAPVSGFLVMAVPGDDIKSERPSELSKTTMAVEDCILWLTEEGLGTCWLGGVNQSQVRTVMGLPKDISIPAIVSFGKPKVKARSADYDGLVHQVQSRRRKPLSKIAFIERMDRPYSVEEIERLPFSASSVQGVRGLLDLLGKGMGEGTEAPLELVVDSCLEAARIAPSASNSQPWQFIVVEEKRNIESLKAACGASGDWRAGIVGAGHESRMASFLFDRPFWMIDLTIALSQMSLMAVSMGCGAATHLDDIDEEAINRLVALPPGFRTVGVMGIL